MKDGQNPFHGVTHHKGGNVLARKKSDAKNKESRRESALTL